MDDARAFRDLEDDTPPGTDRVVDRVLHGHLNHGARRTTEASTKGSHAEHRASKGGNKECARRRRARIQAKAGSAPPVELEGQHTAVAAVVADDAVSVNDRSHAREFAKFPRTRTTSPERADKLAARIEKPEFTRSTVADHDRPVSQANCTEDPVQLIRKLTVGRSDADLRRRPDTPREALCGGSSRAGHKECTGKCDSVFHDRYLPGAAGSPVTFA